MQGNGASTLLGMADIVKRFPGVVALGGVDLDVRPGEVHCLLGQNGAGKSTLIKVLAGVHQPDEGTITWDGQEVSFAHPQAAMDLGIATIYQELDLVEGLTVAENIYLGHERSRFGFSAAPRHREVGRRPPQAPRPHRDLALHRGRRPLRRRTADRLDGAGPLPRREAHHHGRAVGRPGRGRGRAPLPRHPRPHRRGRRRRLHLPPPRGDPHHRRPGHRPQGRQDRGDRPPGEGDPDRPRSSAS